jgi:hypothetical protein
LQHRSNGLAQRHGNRFDNPMIQEDMGQPDSSQPRPSSVMARLTLSALERASQDPAIWRQPEVHHAVLISGLTVMVNAMAHLQADL